MKICTKCHRELKIGQRVIPNFILDGYVPGQNMEQWLINVDYQHSDCWDADGARYRNDGIVVDEHTSRDAVRKLNRVLHEQELRNEAWKPKPEGASNGTESNQSNEG